MIINITGGPDLSLVEVSNASTIVQEAADEDANIIFGAVVDPALKGKVKITVIATGFGCGCAADRAGSSGQTPVDMSNYADVARLRADAGRRPACRRCDRAALVVCVAGRSLICRSPHRRRLPQPALRPGVGDAGRRRGDDGDFDAARRFDVPAFLRRQEG